MPEGVFFISLVIYIFFSHLYMKVKSPILNPLLLSGLLLILLIELGVISLTVYTSSSQLQKMLLPCITIAFAIPLYRCRHIILRHLIALFLGSTVGLFVAFLTVYFPAQWLKFPEILQRSLLVKSITTPVGVELALILKGSPELAAISIFLAGLVGYIFAPIVFTIFKITDPVAKGFSLGLASHVLGAAKAEELGDVEVASAGAAIGVFSAMTAGYLLLWAINN
ncbi:MAG: LrgB family protein [Spirochaetia bacterium]